MNLNEKKLEEELGLLCETEQMSREEMEVFFEQLMKKTERQIHQSPSTLVHQPSVLSLRLRAVAAVFLMVVSGALLLSCSKHLPLLDNGKTYYGPYELAAGHKLVP